MADTVLHNAGKMNVNGESLSSLEGLQSRLRELVERLKTTPSFKTFELHLLQMQIDNLKKKIQKDFGIRVGLGPPPPKIALMPSLRGSDGPRTDSIRETVDGLPSVS